MRNSIKIAIATGATVAILGPLGYFWQDSLVPSTYDMAAMGYPDFGGGQPAGHSHGPGSLSVASLTGPSTGTPDVAVTLTARKQDGRYTLNGTTPGPDIRAVKGQLIQVTLVNDNISDGITLHWHGVDVPNAEDGVAGITQDAVKANQSHVYRFVAQDAGTYWYHSHQVSHEQVRLGLFGALVVTDPAERPADVDQIVDVHTYDGRRTINGAAGVVPLPARPGQVVRARVINTDAGPMRAWVSGAPYRIAAIDGRAVNGALGASTATGPANNSDPTAPVGSTASSAPTGGSPSTPAAGSSPSSTPAGGSGSSASAGGSGKGASEGGSVLVAGTPTSASAGGSGPGAPAGGSGKGASEGGSVLAAGTPTSAPAGGSGTSAPVGGIASSAPANGSAPSAPPNDSSVGSPPDVSDKSVIVTAGGRIDLLFTVPASGAVRVEVGAGSALAAGNAPGSAEPSALVDLLSYGTPAPLGFDPAKATRVFDYRIGRRAGFLDGKPGLWWSINGHLFPDVPMFMVSTGDIVRMKISNSSGEVHPMHLHGHHAVVLSRNGVAATGSPWWFDSLDVGDGETYEIAFVADNPGIWVDHCHNLQHAADGLLAHLAYTNVSTPYRVGGKAGNSPE